MRQTQSPGASAGETDVWLQVKAWNWSYGTDWTSAYRDWSAPYADGEFFGQSDVINVGALGPTTGPGVSVWSAATATAPNKLNAFVVFESIPEPCTFSLIGLSALALLHRGRKG